MKILHVDADRRRLQDFSALLRARQHVVTEVETGRAALVSAGTARPDIVVLRDDLPDIDALALSSELKALSKSSTSFTLYLTAAPAAPLTAFRAGVDLQLAAPVDAAELVRAVDAAVARLALMHPMSPPASDERHEPRTLQPPEHGRADTLVTAKTVLVVDDEKAVRMLAENILRRAGYTVVAMESPATALDWWRDHHSEVTLVVTDAVMPGDSGPAMLARMRRDRPDLSAVLMSGFIDHRAAAIGLDQADLFLQKPFSPEQLRTAVRDQLREKQR